MKVRNLFKRSTQRQSRVALWVKNLWIQMKTHKPEGWCLVEKIWVKIKAEVTLSQELTIRQLASCLAFAFPRNQLLDCLRSSAYRSSSPSSPRLKCQFWLGRKCVISISPSVVLPSSQVSCELWISVGPSYCASHSMFVQFWASTLTSTPSVSAHSALHPGFL